MGRLKKKHNWKARQQLESTEPHVAESSEAIEMEGDYKSHYDTSNPLIVVNKKAQKDKANQQLKKKVAKPLSKSERKKLMKIVESKKRKSNREELLKSLKQNQATPEELAALTSTAAMQTKGLKKSRLSKQDDGKASMEVE